MFDRDRRKRIFDDVASDYDAIRPGYPDAAITRIIEIAEFPERGRVLEIGCGSGQATLSFVDRGYDLVCIDISPALLQIALAKFSAYPNLDFRQIAFEEYAAEDASFDLILAASSWHWIDPVIGYAKAAALLKPSGGLAVMATLPLRPYTGLFERVQDVYRELVPEWSDPNVSRPRAGVIREAEKQMTESGYFREAIPFECCWEQEYTREQYLLLLRTYSDHYLLGPERLETLCGRIGRIIDEEYYGMFICPYVTVGCVGRK